ncbi:hypothetical protein AVEN_2863-1 [Araneus ventricosus]|uniref:Uncharacterized protein n=1 Tax=Araneus ventricosus TaxID=182803 RepID=A0A4Y2DSV5_ARAVE|nr:hypothetical protein AVEN_2863-1 [Araneus ventricosus]
MSDRRISKGAFASPRGIIMAALDPSTSDSMYLFREGSGRGLVILLGLRPQYSSYCRGCHSRPRMLRYTENYELWPGIQKQRDTEATFSPLYGRVTHRINYCYSNIEGPLWPNGKAPASEPEGPRLKIRFHRRSAVFVGLVYA